MSIQQLGFMYCENEILLGITLVGEVAAQCDSNLFRDFNQQGSSSSRESIEPLCQLILAKFLN